MGNMKNETRLELVCEVCEQAYVGCSTFVDLFSCPYCIAEIRRARDLAFVARIERRNHEPSVTFWRKCMPELPWSVSA